VVQSNRVFGQFEPNRFGQLACQIRNGWRVRGSFRGSIGWSGIARFAMENLIESHRLAHTTGDAGGELGSTTDQRDMGE